MDPRHTGREPSPPLPPLPPASREVLEILWSAGRPLRTRQIHDAVARRYPHRAGRRINTTSSLLVALLEAGWVVGRKRGGTRWVYEAAVSRDEGMRLLGRRAVEAFCVQPEAGWYLVWAALDALGPSAGELRDDSGRAGGSGPSLRARGQRGAGTEPYGPRCPHL